MNFKKVFVLCSLIVLISGVGQAVESSRDITESNYVFDKNLEYDIYFQSGDSCSAVVENVQILGIQDFGNKKFLIVQSKGFRLQDARGFILFESISAILPNGNFQVKKDDIHRVPGMKH